jgi:hypothetical protein
VGGDVGGDVGRWAPLRQYVSKIAVALPALSRLWRENEG